METLRLVILTKSAKRSNYCVAGIDLDSGKWVRLVSYQGDSPSGLSSNMLRYKNGRECDVLDVVDVVISKSTPLDIQKENITINENYFLKYIEKYDENWLLDLAKTDGYIFTNNYTYIDRFTALNADCSIDMFYVRDLHISESVNNKGNKKKKLSFNFDGQHYNNLSMTDLNYMNTPSGKIADEGIIVVSIPNDDYNGNYYKFVAQIFPF